MIESRNPGYVDDLLDIIARHKPHGAIARISARYGFNRGTIEDYLSHERPSRATALIIVLEMLDEIERVHPEHADEFFRALLRPYHRTLAHAADETTQSAPTSLALRAMSDVGRAMHALEAALADAVISRVEAEQVDASAGAAVRNLEQLRRVVREKAGLS